MPKQALKMPKETSPPAARTH